MIPFWFNDPTILFQKDFLFELWATENMSYPQKVNAITRLVIVLTLLGYSFTFSYKILVAGICTLIVLFILYKMRKEKVTKEGLLEGFHVERKKKEKEKEKEKSITNPVTLETIVKTEFQEGNKKNPFSNVLLTDIGDKPDRLSAPPAFNPEIEVDISKNVKKSVQYMNPGIKNTNKQLYSSLWDNFELDTSNRNFYSTASTRVANDQGAFGQFLYGNMPSSKESDVGAALQREKDAYRYTLY
jgi:hypothetical protein